MGRKLRSRRSIVGRATAHRGFKSAESRAIFAGETLAGEREGMAGKRISLTLGHS